MSRTSTGAGRRPRPPRARIHLPPLTAHEALLVSNLLDRALAALWRSHGDAIAELLANLEPDAGRTNDPSDPVPSDPATATSDDHIF